MEIHEHIAHLREEGERFARAAEAAGLEAEVPTCPEWRVRDLVQHLGGVHHWATSYVRSGNPRPSSERDDARLFAAIGDADLLHRFRSGHTDLVAALGAAGPDLSCWTFLPAPSPLAFWARRQAHETTIHRADAEIASGSSPTCAPAFAADGIDELLNGFFSRARGRLVSDPAVALAISTTDTAEAWTIRIEPDRRVVSPGARDADCRVSGTASDLYLLLWNRRPVDERLAVEGDRGVLDLWRRAAVVR